MNRIEKLFALKRAPLFCGLDDSELMLIADVAAVRRFSPGEKLNEAGAVLRRLYVAIDGGFVREGTGKPEFPVLGIDSLVLENICPEARIADPQTGALCLTFSKGRFFTIISECPDILISYLDQVASKRDARQVLSENPA